MNNTQSLRTRPFPDVAMVDSELYMTDKWDTNAVSELIRSKSDNGETPAFLFLGRHEASLLQAHLGAAFGPESVVTLRDTYYMGLEVIQIDCEAFVCTGGRKTVRTLQDPISRRPEWRDRDTEGLWQFRI